MNIEITEILNNIWEADKGQLDHNGEKYNLIGHIGEMQIWGKPVGSDKVSIIVEGDDPRLLHIDTLLAYAQTNVMDWVR